MVESNAMNLDLINDLAVPSLVWSVIAVTVMVLVDRSRNTPAAALHLFLFMTLMGGVLVLFGAGLPSLEWAIVPEVMQPWLSHQLFVPYSRTWIDIALLIYLTVTVCMFCRFCFSVADAYRLLFKCENVDEPGHAGHLTALRDKLGIRRAVKLYYSRQIGSPVTFGWFRPYVVLPIGSLHWSEEMFVDFLSHELVHIRRNDWLRLLLAKLVCAVLWFLPPAHGLLRRMSWFAELATDDWVVTANGGRIRYARNLLRISAESRSHCGAVGLIDRSTIYQRIAASLDGARVRSSPTLIHYFYLSVVLSAIAVGSSINLTAAPAGEQLLIRTSLNVGASESFDSTLSSVQVEPPDFSLKPPKKPEFFSQPQANNIIDYPSAVDVEREWEEIKLREPRPAKTISLTLPQRPTIKVRKRVVPQYPKSALRRAEQGKVTLIFNVTASGQVEDIRVARSSGVEALDRAAKRALSDYEFFPLENTATVSGVTETFYFYLKP